MTISAALTLAVPENTDLLRLSVAESDDLVAFLESLAAGGP